MKKINDYLITFNSDVLEEQVTEFLNYYQKSAALVHSLQVANEAKKLAESFCVSPDKAFVAGLLHDISAVIPDDARVALQNKRLVEVLVEEEIVPMLIHQKQSAYIAKEIFGIENKEVLSAIACHTTLKSNASVMDKVVFIADKIKWDRIGEPPYLKILNEALSNSLDEGCRVYIKWLLSDLVILHPWLKAAMSDLKLTDNVN